ncbi:hypothetical protein [Methanosarcina sp. Kolksee]|uniref:hypothetical protein n=1 Tax=Methanosarcina sp. Kolksee TaxID=1434099 RepID=UPI0018CD62CC|nr:hypothetical protein [Methanosarcina sp. Kolksee]
MWVEIILYLKITEPERINVDSKVGVLTQLFSRDLYAPDKESIFIGVMIVPCFGQ